MFNRKNLIAVLTFYIAAVFVQSLFYKFTDSPETQYIFGTLNGWAISLGAPALFAPNGLFSQYVIGTAELLASALLLIGHFAGKRLIHALGAAMALGVISGAIVFHLFTPLGIAVRNADGSLDGGQLFALACGVWISSAMILWLRRDLLVSLLPHRATKAAENIAVLSDLGQLAHWFAYPALAAQAGSSPLAIALALFFATFLLEDAAIAAGAALVAHGAITFELAFSALVCGIILGDYGLFLMGRYARRYAIVRTRLERLPQLQAAPLGLQLLLARVVPGLRLLTYPASGLIGIASARFIQWIALWATLWTAGLLGMASGLAAPVAEEVGLPPAFIAAAVVLIMWLAARMFEKARRT